MIIIFEPQAGPDIIGWAQVAVGILGVLVAASVALFVATKQIKHQKKAEHAREVRQASAALIQAIHDLAQQSEDPERNNKLDRNRMYQVSAVFELTAGDTIDQTRFNYAINWILKAATLRYQYAISERDQGQLIEAHKTFIDNLVFHMTHCLRDYDPSDSSYDLAQRIATKFGKSYHSQGRYADPEIIRLFTGGRNIYRGLTKKDPLGESGSSASFEKPY